MINLRLHATVKQQLVPTTGEVHGEKLQGHGFSRAERTAAK
jgi:hypothetical protein